MTTATEVTTSTLEQLRDRLEQQQAEVEAAKSALGAATLDTTDPRKASKRVVDAEAAVTRTEAAIAELERRKAVQAEHAAAVATAEENLRIYNWIAEYATRAEVVLDPAGTLKVAEDELAAHRPTSNLLYRFVTRLDRKLDHEVPFDATGPQRALRQEGLAGEDRAGPSAPDARRRPPGP
jgi:hypothetical protein